MRAERTQHCSLSDFLEFIESDADDSVVAHLMTAVLARFSTQIENYLSESNSAGQDIAGSCDDFSSIISTFKKNRSAHLVTADALRYCIDLSSLICSASATGDEFVAGLRFYKAILDYCKNDNPELNANKDSLSNRLSLISSSQLYTNGLDSILICKDFTAMLSYLKACSSVLCEAEQCAKSIQSKSERLKFIKNCSDNLNVVSKNMLDLSSSLFSFKVADNDTEKMKELMSLTCDIYIKLYFGENFQKALAIEPMPKLFGFDRVIQIINGIGEDNGSAALGAIKLLSTYRMSKRSDEVRDMLAMTSSKQAILDLLKETSFDTLNMDNSKKDGFALFKNDFFKDRTLASEMSSTAKKRRVSEDFEI